MAPKGDGILSEPQGRDVLADVLLPTVEVGIASGTAGLIVGGAAGILRSAPPVLFALVSGVQCFTLGSSFYVARLFAQDLQRQPIHRSAEYASSGMAGCVAGAMTGALRSRAHVLPGAIMMGILGLGFQAGVETFTHDVSGPRQKSILDSIASSRWVPLKPLSDEEYDQILRERLLKTEAELSMINDEINDLKASAARNQP